MSKLNCLMLGVGHDQLPMIREAIDLGIGVIGLDGNPEAEGKKFVNQFEHVNIKDPDEVEKVALKWNKKVGIDGVIAPAVEVGISVGRVVDKLGLPGINEDNALHMTDKVCRRRVLDAYQIPQPEWAYREEKRAGLWDIFPCVVKPRDQSAAVGVRIAYNMGEIGVGYDYLEEYLEGWELSVEVLVFKNKTYLTAIADRNYDKKLKWKPFLLEDGCSYPSKIPEPIKRKIDFMIYKVITGYNISDCAIKFDLLVKNNIVYVIEVAPRLGGGKLSSDMIPIASGIKWWRMALKIAMAIPVDQSDLETNKGLYCAQRYKFPNKPTSHKDRLFSVECTGKTYDEAIKNAEIKLSQS